MHRRNLQRRWRGLHRCVDARLFLSPVRDVRARLTGSSKHGVGISFRSACSAGSYSMANATVCTGCPSNSNSASGAATCSCATGYGTSGSGDTLLCTRTYLLVKARRRLYATTNTIGWLKPRMVYSQSAPPTAMPFLAAHARRARPAARAAADRTPAPAPMATRAVARAAPLCAQVRAIDGRERDQMAYANACQMSFV